jgi:hypothetical protein
MDTPGSTAGAAGDVDHPMATLAGAQAIIASIPMADPVKAAQDAALWLASIISATNFSVDHRYALIDLIDVALGRRIGQLLPQYLALKPHAKFQEGLLWRAAMGYWKALGDAYMGCVSQAKVDKGAAVLFRDRFPQAVARAMRVQVLQIKWILMRYGYVSDVYWTTVAKLYRYAESGAFLDDTMDIYAPGHGAESYTGDAEHQSDGHAGNAGAQCRGSIRQDFLRALMMGVSSTGGLSPIKQDIAERVIGHFSNAFVSSTRANAGCNFFFDLHGGMSPARVLAEAPRGARLFYFGAGQALEATQGAVEMVNEKGVLPPDIHIDTSANTDQVADTLLHLAFNWEKELPARDSERRKVATTLQIAHGFDGVLAAGGNPLQETWVVENASGEGYGMIVPERRGEWLQVGVLIGFLPEDDNARWGAGVVRRVETDALGQRRVGIQVLSRAVMPGTMCTWKSSGDRGVPHNVVLLDAKPSRSGYMQILLRPESFTLRDLLEATRLSDGKSFVVMPSGMVESGPDFDRVRFKATPAL